MNLKGKYELVVYYELPDGNFIPAKKIVDFFLKENYETIQKLKDSINDGYLHFDDTSYGILDVSSGYYEIIMLMRNLGYTDTWDKIIKANDLLTLLEKMKEDARDLCNNMKEHEREIKLKMIIE